MISLIISLAVAAFIGFLAGNIMDLNKPWYVNILLGLIGGSVGSFVFGLFGISSSNIFGHIIISTIGACIVIFLAKKIAK